MRIGLVFPHDPMTRPPGIELIRLEALARGFRQRGASADIMAPVERPAVWRGGLEIRPVAELSDGGYDIVKACYHQSIRLTEGFPGPVVVRLVRVVDRRRPERDRTRRSELLADQESVARRAAAVAFNNPENHARWIRRHGPAPPAILTPTGCPERLPAQRGRPLAGHRPAVLYLGSLASPRQVDMLNAAARSLAGLADVHLVGRNKSGLYGRHRRLDPQVVDHGPVEPELTWDYLRSADLGLGLATGPDAFDNDSSKVVHYLRAGLPTLVEAPILQADLVESLGLGRRFGYGRRDALRAAAMNLLEQPPPPARRRAAAAYMAREHAWIHRVDDYLSLFRRLLGGGSP